ncbi:unnamed protein product [Rhizophagus irregularis]|nr:unnamed protein product [Rhizophagus irregularis]
MVRYRDLLSLTENHTLSWIDLYNQHLVEINDDSNDLIGPAVDDIQEVEEITTGLTKVCCDILKLRRQKASSSRQLVTTSIDLRTLSEKQRLIRERVESIAPLRIIVMGTAGTGKSYLINAIRRRLYEIVKEHNLHENNMVIVPTGVNIEGTLSVPIFGVNVELEGESLKRLQRKLKYIEYFIVCRSIILVGDFGQLPPVCDVPIVFSGLSKSDHLSKVVASSQFQEIYKLEAIQIQQVTRINNNNSEISYITYVMKGLHDPTGNY